jgi:hypothetical protein
VGTTLGEVLGSLRADSPWLLLVAGVVFAGASAAYKRAAGSMQRIGARVGALETLAEKERTRRRQVEAVLLELGIPLPYWPDDPANGRELAVLRRRARLTDLENDNEDQDHEQPLTREAKLPPVPTERAGVHRGSR